MQGILLELPLAAFFVKKLLGRACDVNDLPSLDPQLYASLISLRGYQGNVEDLSLYFSIASPDNPLKEVRQDCGFKMYGYRMGARVKGQMLTGRRIHACLLLALAMERSAAREVRACVLRGPDDGRLCVRACRPGLISHQVAGLGRPDSCRGGR